MKKTLIIALAALLVPVAANAQLGGLIKKAAEKTVNKATEKIVDKAADAAADAVTKEVDKRLPKDEPTATTTATVNTEKATCESLMRQLPELPSVDQLVKHKEAELNEKTFKLVTSKVTVFSAKVLDLSTQCAALGYDDLDSAKAYQMAAAYTGLTPEELEQLSNMSEEEQQAWLEKHYSQQRAQTAMTQQAVDASKWLEPLQPTIDKWSAAGEKADAVYKEMATKLKPIYAKYADRLAAANSQERVNLMVAYYTEAVPYIRTAVQQALNIRLKEQLPIAEQLEAEMVKIRAEHPDAVSQLLNYPKLTATMYFTEVSHLLEIPQYSD